MQNPRNSGVAGCSNISTDACSERMLDSHASTVLLVTNSNPLPLSGVVAADVCQLLPLPLSVLLQRG